MENSVVNRIEALKKEKNAVILAHYYAPAEAQKLADHVGDSYYLAKLATRTDADIVVFCGVGFMGESVKMLNPDKKVLMPDPSADCAMAHMASVERIADLRSKYDDLAVVCYINSTAALKSVSDVCVTSSNAVKIVRALPNKNIFFIPDKNLGSYVASQLPEKNIILNDGCCPIHASLRAHSVERIKKMYPHAKVLTHPECLPEILELSDYIGSTAEILAYAAENDGMEFIVCTEEGVAYALTEKSPEKMFYFPAELPPCADMKLNTPEKILETLENEINEIKVDRETCDRARIPLERMLELAK